MLLKSCRSVEVHVPPVEFPDFPIMSDNTGNKVEVPEEWIVRLAEFKIRYEALQDEWQEYKDLYSGRK